MTIKQRAFVIVCGLFLVSGLSVAASRAELRAGFGGGTAYGSITLESKNPKQIYDQILKICKEFKASIISFNCYSQSPGRNQISAQIQVDKDKAAEFMLQMSTLAEVRNQSLTQSYGQNPDQLKKQLGDLDKELKDILGNRYPVLVMYGLQQKQSLQSQLQQMEATGNSVTISLNIQEPNQDQSAFKTRTIELYSVLYLAVAFALGVFLAKRLSIVKV